MTIKDAVLDYQQECRQSYAASVGLPATYAYPDGNPIRPVPPVCTHVGGLMIVGAYPSARFEARPSRRSHGRYRLVPIADNLQPFGDEQYFDGVRVRTLESGDGLQKYLLDELGPSREDCWITDLVKVFLYKPAHIASCADACPGFAGIEQRSRYAELARASLPWLRRECELCQPKLVVTLGLEVAQAISGEPQSSADDLLLRKISTVEALGGSPVLFLPHPDACRRYEKWRKRMRLGVRLIKPYLAAPGTVAC